jgi:hypothetical protein
MMFPLTQDSLVGYAEWWVVNSRLLRQGGLIKGGRQTLAEYAR